MLGFWRNWWRPNVALDQASRPAEPRRSVDKARSARRTAEVMKDRPRSLAPTDYQLVQDPETVAQLFERLRGMLFELARADAGRVDASRYRLEMGRLAGDTRYFYLQPWSESGWLFEQTASGWLVAIADQIVGQETFLKGAESWDAVALLKPMGREGLVRLSSKRFAGELVSFPVYADQLAQALGLSGGEA